MNQSYAGLALDKTQIERQINEMDAVKAIAHRQGYRFIPLTLNDLRRRAVVGVEVLHATPYSDASLGGLTNYHLHLRGGHIGFMFFGGAFTAQLLDTEHNRQFLASHYDRNYWSIDDTTVEADIQKRYQRMVQQLRREQPAMEAQRPKILARNEAEMKAPPHLVKARQTQFQSVSTPIPPELGGTTTSDSATENTTVVKVDVSDVVEKIPKPKRGRPKKVDSTVKRKRGRPKKTNAPQGTPVTHAHPVVTGVQPDDGLVTVGVGVNAP